MTTRSKTHTSDRPSAAPSLSSPAISRYRTVVPSLSSKSPRRRGMVPSSDLLDPAELDQQRRDRFWRWVLLAALAHILFFTTFALISWLNTPALPPPPPAISWLNVGDIVQGHPTEAAAPKVSPAATQPPRVVSQPKPAAVTPPPSKPAMPVSPPVVAKVVPSTPTPAPTSVPDSALAPLPDIPPVLPPKPPQVAPVPKLKPSDVKVDLNDVVTTTDPAPKVKSAEKPVVKPTPTVDISHDQVVDEPNPAPAPAKPVKPKIKPHPKTDNSADSTPAPDSTPGLTSAQVAQKLSQTLENAGVEQLQKVGVDGAANATPSDYASFLSVIHDQVYDTWIQPNLSQESGTAVVTIHILPDGTVPSDQVTLTRSSGNEQLDASALTAARHLDKLRQALPNGCPPDIPINFKLSH